MLWSLYNGTLHDTSALVAMKRIAKDSQQGLEFFVEVSTISCVKHHNLVQL
jgi:hypothetical protein